MTRVLRARRARVVVGAENAWRALGFAEGFAAASSVEVGRILASDLTPYATSDPNNVLVSGTPLSGVVAAGAAQAGPSAGAWAFYPLTRDALGETWSDARALDVLSQTLLVRGMNFSNQGFAVGVGLVWGAGAAPTTFAQIVSRSMLLLRDGDADDETEPGYYSPAGVEAWDTGGGAASDKQHVRFSSTFRYDLTDPVLSTMGRYQLVSMKADATEVNGSLLSGAPFASMSAAGRKAAIASCVWRPGTVLDPTAYTVDGSVFPVLAPEPPLA